jgi:hypothetical protein
MEFSLAHDESTDIQGSAQLLVFVCYMFTDVIVKEEISDLVALKETAQCAYVRNAPDAILINACVLLNKIVGVAIACSTCNVR